MKKNFNLLLVLVGASFLACTDLDVENLNNPALVDVYDDTSEFNEIINGSFLSFWQGTELSDPAWPLTVTAQVGSSSWGNWGAWDLGRIPREPIQNNLNYVYRTMLESPWNTLNGAIGNVNNPLRILAETDGSVIIEDVDRTDEVIAKGKFIQGIVHGYLGLLFDQAYTVDENTDLTEVQLRPWNEVIDFAKEKLVESIALSEANSFTVTGFNGVSMSNVEFAQLARTFIAQFEAYKARTPTETPNADWNEVLQMTANGIQTDFAPVGDAQFWWTRLKIQGQDPVWMRVSQRIIKMMEPSAVYPWPDGTSSLPAIEDPIDNRINTDFEYGGAPAFQAARGYYFFGSYRYSRYQAYRETLTEPMMHTPVVENGLLRAEALVRTGGNLSEAAQLINATRVTRGGLAPVTAGTPPADLLRAITYERLVELGWAGTGKGYFARRTTTAADLALEPGTIEHLPVPARELNILGLPVYTTGGI